MAATRKDSRGYALRRGEFQRKDGRYQYTYMDAEKHRHTVYAKDLAGIRAKERKIIRDREDGLDPALAERLTLNDMFDKYIAQKYDLKRATRNNYIYTYDHFVRDTFGRRKLARIKYSDVKEFYYSFLITKQMQPATLDNVHTLIHPTLQLAVRDGLLRINPSDDVMNEIKKSHVWKKNPRHALTATQQKAFMKYVEESELYRGWLPMLTILLGTGLRIGELLGLRWDDLDFDKRLISVNHTLVYRPNEERKSEMMISTPKTEAGCRTVPMLDEVYDAFLEEYEISKAIGAPKCKVEGYTNFVFVTAYGQVYCPNALNRAIRMCVKGYNEDEIALAKAEKREPELMPEFSAHNLRHTFCTRLCENESNLKLIQSIMGHADISTTMNIYAEATDEKKQEEIEKLNGKIIIR